MKTAKRPWTRAEKSLFLAPLLIALMAGAIWSWQILAPVVLKVQGAESIRSVEWSPDGRRLVVFATFPTGAPFGHTRGMVYDVATRAKICDLASPPPSPVGQSLWFNHPSWSPDGTRLVAGYSDGTRGTVKIPNLYPKRKKTDPNFHFNTIGKIAVWDARTGNLTGKYLYAPPNENSFAGVYFSRDGKHFIGFERPPALFDARSGARLRRVGSASTTQGAFNLAETLVALEKSQASKFEVRDIRTGKKLWQPAVSDAGWARWSSGDVLGVINYGKNRRKSLLLWDGKTRRSLPSPPFKNVWQFRFSRTAPLVAVLEFDQTRPKTSFFPATIVVWNYRQNRIVWQRRMEGVDSLSYSRDGKWLAVHAFNSKENGAWIFDATGKAKMRRAFKNLHGINWARDSKRLAIYGENRIEIVRVAD